MKIKKNLIGCLFHSQSKKKQINSNHFHHKNLTISFPLTSSILKKKELLIVKKNNKETVKQIKYLISPKPNVLNVSSLRSILYKENISIRVQTTHKKCIGNTLIRKIVRIFFFFSFIHSKIL